MLILHIFSFINPLNLESKTLNSNPYTKWNQGVLILLIYSFWVPQIVHNMHHDHRKPLLIRSKPYTLNPKPKH